MGTRLVENWVYGGSLAGLTLLALLPVLARDWSTAQLMIFLMLPLYMVHQYEEHDDDRFRRFFNTSIGEGKEVLSRAAVFVINVPGVWGVIAVSYALAVLVDPGLGLIGIYLVLVNAAVHILHALLFRGYHPGLGTAILLFLPLSMFGLWAVQAAGAGQPHWHALGLASGILIHGAIMGYAKSKGAFAKSAPAEGST